MTKALATPLSIDMGVDFVLPVKEFLSVTESVEHLPMKTIFNVEDTAMDSTENWLKNYTTNTENHLDYYSKVTLRLPDHDRYVSSDGGVLCAILALIGILNCIAIF